MNNVMNAQLCYKILIRFMRPRVILYSVISNQSWILMTVYGKGVFRKSKRCQNPVLSYSFYTLSFQFNFEP
jgi:hypothetical protein